MVEFARQWRQFLQHTHLVRVIRRVAQQFLIRFISLLLLLFRDELFPQVQQDPDALLVRMQEAGFPCCP
jgi:hypothetical protein